MVTMCGMWNGSCSGTSCCTASQGLVDVSVSGNPKVANGKGDARWTPGNVFVGVQSSSYWSATEHSAGAAWGVGLNGGNVFFGTKFFNSPFVWPVRVGQ